MYKVHYRYIDYITLISNYLIPMSGFPDLSEKSASRVALIQITVFGLLVYNYYSAAIVSARLNEPLMKMNDSLVSLANSKMGLAAEHNVFFNFLLRVMIYTDTLYTNSTFQFSFFFRSHEDLNFARTLHRMCSTSSVFGMLYRTTRNLCLLRMA